MFPKKSVGLLFSVLLIQQSNILQLIALCFPFLLPVWNKLANTACAFLELPGKLRAGGIRKFWKSGNDWTGKAVTQQEGQIAQQTICFWDKSGWRRRPGAFAEVGLWWGPSRAVPSGWESRVVSELWEGTPVSLGQRGPCFLLLRSVGMLRAGRQQLLPPEGLPDKLPLPAAPACALCYSALHSELSCQQQDWKNDVCCWLK